MVHSLHHQIELQVAYQYRKLKADIHHFTDSREHGTDGKLLLLGCEDSNLKVIDLRSQQQVSNFSSESVTVTVTICRSSI